MFIFTTFHISQSSSVLCPSSLPSLPSSSSWLSSLLLLLSFQFQTYQAVLTFTSEHIDLVGGKVSNESGASVNYHPSQRPPGERRPGWPVPLWLLGKMSRCTRLVGLISLVLFMIFPLPLSGTSLCPGRRHLSLSPQAFAIISWSHSPRSLPSCFISVWLLELQQNNWKNVMQHCRVCYT